jgi:hypothetical protein
MTRWFAISEPVNGGSLPILAQHFRIAFTDSWRYFERSYSFLRFFEKYTFNSDSVVSFDDPGLGFMNVLATGNLPSVTYIDPHFAASLRRHSGHPEVVIQDKEDLLRRHLSHYLAVLGQAQRRASGLTQPSG